MTSTRRTSVTVGGLLIVATSAAVAAAAVLPTLSGPGFPTGVAGHPPEMAVAALLYLVAAGTSVGIAIALYPLLRESDAALALGSVVFRAIEAVFYTVGVVVLLSVLTLGDQFVSASPAGRAPIRALADTLLGLREHASLVAVLAFSVGALMYYVVFLHTRLVPRWLSVFGIVAVLLVVVACLLALFSNSDVTGYKVLLAPIFVQELVMAGWLLAKGFSATPAQVRAPSERRSGASETTAGRP